ncbi:MAG: hypothetical protein RR482_06615 [Clostridia bacterium]
MKNFEMPIVAMNEMAMNESIASDCCYAYTETGLDRISKVINGGTIGTVKVNCWKSDIAANLKIDQFKGIIPACPHYYSVMTNEGLLNPGSVTKIWFMANGGRITPNNGNDGFTPAQEAERAAGYRTSWTGSAYCTHDSSQCPWISIAAAQNQQHIGATVPHALGGVGWAQPHKAYQFNS